MCVRGSSLFALERHDASDDGAKWILEADEPRTQWESITSCCRMLIGLETSKDRRSYSGISVWAKNSADNFWLSCVCYILETICAIILLEDLSCARTAQQL